jgi:membrane fusion protein, multidrug efflux system
MRITVGSISVWLAATAVLATIACSPESEAPGRATNGRRESGPASVPVTTATVDEKPMPLSVSVIGTGEAFSNVAVHPQITGELTSVDFKEGADVQKGEIIFTLDYRPLESALKQAQANLARDTVQAANARASATRYQDLDVAGIGTSEQADVARTSAAALDATVQSDQAAVENAKVQLQYATIMAPLSGRTGALMVHEGNLVRATDTTPLVVINQISPMYVSFAVPEALLPDVKHYMAQGSATVEASAPGETSTSKGRITFIDNAVDATTGQIKLKGIFPNEDRRLWPGQFVNVTLTLKVEQNAIVVPTAAVQTGEQGNYVFVLKPDGTVDQRPISVEREAGDETVVQDGLKRGDIVVTDGQPRLTAGTRVSVKSGPGESDGPSAKATS